MAILTALILTGMGTGREETKRRKWHEKQDLDSEQKKTARTFCCSCREASDANYFQPGGVSNYRLPNWNIYTIL